MELFDLSVDEGEKNNLAAQMPEKTESMLANLLSTEQSIGNLREKGRKALQKRLDRKKSK